MLKNYFHVKLTEAGRCLTSCCSSRGGWWCWRRCRGRGSWGWGRGWPPPASTATWSSVSISSPWSSSTTSTSSWTGKFRRGPNLFFKFFSWVWYDPHLTYLWWPSKVKLFSVKKGFNIGDLPKCVKWAISKKEILRLKFKVLSLLDIAAYMRIICIYMHVPYLSRQRLLAHINFSIIATLIKQEGNIQKSILTGEIRTIKKPPL